MNASFLTATELKEYESALNEYESIQEEANLIAQRQFEGLRKELLDREAKRKKLWGNQYPFVYTRYIQPPPVEKKPKRKKAKAKTRKKTKKKYVVLNPPRKKKPARNKKGNRITGRHP